MALAIVTDSTADLAPRLVQQLAISVVPLTVRFGEKSYRDGVDITPDEFYRNLTQEQGLPVTAAPGPGVFTELYQALLSQGHQVLSIHLSGKLSATYNSARLGMEALGPGQSVEVIDSMTVSMGMGLLVLQAARAARAGLKLEEVSAIVRQTMGRARLFGALDTLEYLHKGGRIGRAQAFLGSMLNFKPLVTVRDGEVHPLERVRTMAKAKARLVELVRSVPAIEELAVIHATTEDEVEKLAASLQPLVPDKEICRARFGPVLGTYVGPGVLGVALIEK